jgi:hypothetical protein
MSIDSRRGLNLGVALLAVGLYLILGRELSFRGPGPILLLIGTILLVVAALRHWRGPTVAAGVLLGLGTAFLVRDPLERWMPGWATLLLGIGAGLLLAAGLDRAAGRPPRPGILTPGAVLVAIALVTAISENLRVPEAFSEALWRLWPWVIVAAGVVLVVRALAVRRSP